MCWERLTEGRSFLRPIVEVEHGEEGLLRHLDRADLLHPPLARLLLLEQLAFAADVAAVALRKHALPLRLDRLPRDHARADRRLHGDVEVLARDLLPAALDQRLAARIGGIAVAAHPERVHRHVTDHDLHTREPPAASSSRGISAGLCTSSHSPFRSSTR